MTLGDPAGIGPDITLLSWRDRAALALPPFAVYGEAVVLRERAQALGLDVPMAVVDGVEEAPRIFARALPVLEMGAAPGTRPARALAPTPMPASSPPSSRRRPPCWAAQPWRSSPTPSPRSRCSRSRSNIPATPRSSAKLAERHTGQRGVRPVMMLAAPGLRVVPATVHIPLAAVPRALTRRLIVETGRITACALAQDFGVAAPRIAVAGLNPHAGENGLIGSEEAEIIVPAIEELRREGLAVTGPHSADSLFHDEARRGYDAAIAMYHDQALIPLKTLAFDRGVNVTLGLPFVRTSPDHGTAYALAGTGRARPASFIAALKLAAELGQRRRSALTPAAPRPA